MGRHNPELSTRLKTALIAKAQRSLVESANNQRMHPLQIPGLVASGLQHLTFTPLSEDDKVRVCGTEVQVDPGYLDLLVEQADDITEVVAALALYVVHELIHIAQGIDDKKRVRQLRRAGGEEALMHLDLHADHLAAMALVGVQPDWSLLWLKEVQCAALYDFPILGSHGLDAARRKELRALSIQCDVACRRAGVVEVDCPGYVYVVHGHAKEATVVVRGTIDRVVSDASAIRDQHSGRLSVALPGAGRVVGPPRPTTGSIEGRKAA